MDITINGVTYPNAFVYLLGTREDCSADIYTHGNAPDDAPPRFHTADVQGEGEEARYTWNSSESVSPEDYDRLSGPSYDGSVSYG